MNRKRITTILIALILTFSMMGTGALGQDEVTEPAQTKPTQEVLEPAQVQTSTTYNTVTLQWAAVDGAAGYTIYRAESAKGEYIAIKKLGPKTTKYTEKSLTTGKKLYYKVEVLWNGEVADTESDELDAVNPVVAVPELDQPEVSGAAQSRITVQVKWTKVKGAQGYRVYKYDTKKKKYKRLKTVSSKTTAYKQTKLAAGSKNQYVVTAYRTNDGITANTESDDLVVKTPKKLTMQTPNFWSTNAGKVIKQAKKKKGCRYVWGASGPNVFDCSGFTCYTMKKAGAKTVGVKVPRLSSRGLYQKYKKYSLGRSLSVAQPGDIIIIGYGGSSHAIFHVGIYYDKGKYIHANGTKVAISKVPKNMVVAVIRLPGLE